MPRKDIDAVDTHVGSKVRNLRIRIGMTQQTLGSAIGLTFQQVQKYEKGTNRISSSRMSQIANALGVPPTFFFEGVPGKKNKVTLKGQSFDYPAKFVASSEGLALIRAYQKVPKDIQYFIVKLVEKIAEHQ